MRRHITNQHGFHISLLILVLAVMGVVGLTAWTLFSKKPTSHDTPGSVDTVRPAATQATAYTSWSFDGNNWKAKGTPPRCEEPLSIAAPIDVTRITSVLYPGQIRGGDFKPHGGMAIDTATNNGAVIYTVRDAYLYQGARYIEQGELQYMLDFIDPCGIRFRFDHLSSLADAFKKYVEQLPGPLVDDSRTHPIAERPYFKKGTVVATEIGFRKQLNVGFDLGVYDLRQRNAASKTTVYKTDSGRINDKELSFYAVCWFDLLPDRERAIVNALPARDPVSNKSSDYCK